jgi:hypothetical protein
LSPATSRNDAEPGVQLLPRRRRGINGIGIYRQQRNVGLKVKRDQILATGCKLIVSPCHNCWDAIRDLEEVYELGIKQTFLKPLLIKMAIIPEHLKPQEEGEEEE